ncbi:unnamed protein product [Arctia plantaginis]|uniref:Uncharacterized protein n=1 Tax=Arctia plantaginis TaxID=874455 RepID=A0A8S0YNP4_ARCPL|nr:unnamed protein product [Arctia plantaginis]CAB3251300.1 unnamed protein product [Arctia plantaginis]
MGEEICFDYLQKSSENDELEANGSSSVLVTETNVDDIPSGSSCEDDIPSGSRVYFIQQKYYPQEIF